MNALRSRLIHGAHQILIDILGHERDHRRRTLADRHKRCVECHVSVDLILLHALCPETLTASSDIPVAHIIDKIIQRSCSLRDAVVGKVVVHFLNHRIQLGEQPFVHHGKLLIVKRIFRCVKIVNVRIQHEECIGIPERTHELALSLLHEFAVKPLRNPRRTARVEIPADRVCTVGRERLKRVYRISFGFAHLLSVLVLHMSHDNDILKRSLVE